jgi:predicted Fe-Mo cluster-binding NifX family protein
MKIAFPTLGNRGLEEQIGEHFGRAPTYTIFDLEKEEIKIVPNSGIHMGGLLSPPEILAREGVKILICKGLGRKAVERFRSSGIEVYSAGDALNVKEAIDAFRKGNLRKISFEEACHGHSNHH